MILNLLNQLALTSSRLEKERILKDNFSNELLKKVFWATYNPDITYWIKKTPEVKNHYRTMDLGTAIDEILSTVASRKVTGNSAVNFYHNILQSLSANDAEVLSRVVVGDLRCGVSVSTINKIWNTLIPVYDWMLASTDSKELVFPCYVQNKFDGMRSSVTRNFEGMRGQFVRTSDDKIIIRTRSGKVIESLGILYDEIRKIIRLGETFDGELVCYANGKFLPRKVSNGILNKAIRGTITPKEADLVVFLCWDIVDPTQSIPYFQRLRDMNERFETAKTIKIFSVETDMVYSADEITVLFNQALELGEEGVIAKNIHSVWQPKRTKDIVKFKAELTADLEVVGYNPGKGKYANMMGSLICETSDGKIRVDVGSKFSDAQRLESIPIGKIIEVMYNCRISKKGSDIDSLYLARFLRVREDKTVANSSEEVE